MSNCFHSSRKIKTYDDRGGSRRSIDEVPVHVEHAHRVVRKVAEQVGRQVQASVGTAGALVHNSRDRRLAVSVDSNLLEAVRTGISRPKHR